MSQKSQSKILVVDDNPDNIQVIGNVLREAGYIVGFATDGAQALNLLQKTDNYDLVLLDVDMPILNGYDTCKAMRNKENLRELPVIFLTAFTDIENKITGFEAGAQDYVTKPYHALELLSRVHTHVELKKSRERLKEVNAWLEDQVREKTLELERALSSLSHLDKLKTNFLFQISEEIKTPLNGILGTINLVKNEDRSPAVKDMIDILEISLSRLENFVSKAVFSTQLTEKEFQLKLTQINISELLKYAIIDLNKIIQNKSLSVSINALPGNFLIQADKDLLFKVFIYILENAINYSPRGAEIEILIDSDKDKTQVAIIDQGPGFSMENLNNLKSGVESGHDLTEEKTGISLHIAKQIIDLHHEKMSLENTETGGARVVLSFNSVK